MLGRCATRAAVDCGLQWRSILVGGMIACAVRQMISSIMSIELLPKGRCDQSKELLNVQGGKSTKCGELLMEINVSSRARV